MPEPILVLIVEDCRDTAATLSTLLKLWGMRAATAHDGETAQAKVAEVRPDVILLDLGLPDMRGEELVRHMRAKNDGDAAVMVAMSGHPREEWNSPLEGCHHYLEKPVDLDQLRAILVGCAVAPTRRVSEGIPR
jgi:CheY-like chemotaxis protein